MEIVTITQENALMVSNLHTNIGAIYTKLGNQELAQWHMEKGIQIINEYGLAYNHDTIPKLVNYAILLANMERVQEGIDILHFLESYMQKEDSTDSFDYTNIQEALGNLYLILGNLEKTKKCYKRVRENYKKIFIDDPQIIADKDNELYQNILKMAYPLAKKISRENRNIHEFINEKEINDENIQIILKKILDVLYGENNK